MLPYAEIPIPLLVGIGGGVTDATPVCCRLGLFILVANACSTSISLKRTTLYSDWPIFSDSTRENDVEQALATKINRPSLQQTGVSSVTPPPIPTRTGIGVAAHGSTPSLQDLGLCPQSTSIRFRGIDFLPTSPFDELTSQYQSIFWWQYPLTLRAPRTITWTTTGPAIPGSVTSHVVVPGDTLRMFEVRRATPWSIDGFHIRLFLSLIHI